MKHGRMINGVTLLGTGLKLNANDLVELHETTNLPDKKNHYFARKAEWNENDSILIEKSEVKLVNF